MERKKILVCNKIRCKICGDVLSSDYTHDFQVCRCWKESGGDRGCAVDGGLDYAKRCGDPEDYEDLSEWRLYTDAERDAYNEHKLLLAEQYPGMFNLDLME